MPSGIIVIDKPSDWTSMDVCAKLRGRFHEKRVGHGGTLDPMATGVLPVFLGRATRAVTFASESEKEYQFGLKLGVVTNTQDVTGEIVRQTPFIGTAEDLLAVLPKFRGDIQQVPPMYSAIKINGQKLYDLARKGREVERAPRPVTIHALELEDQLGPDEFLLRVRCSKGTYVRTLCHDIGAAVGCGGCMSSLRRTMAAGFTLADSDTLDAVLQADDPAALLLPVDAYFSGYPDLVADPEQEKRIRNGAALPMPGLPDGRYRVYGQDGTFLALSQGENGVLTTVKSFYEV